MSAVRRLLAQPFYERYYTTDFRSCKVFERHFSKKIKNFFGLIRSDRFPSFDILFPFTTSGIGISRNIAENRCIYINV